MKKRFLLVLLTIILVGCFALVACQFPVTPPTDDDKGWGEVFTLETAYAEAQSLGYTGSLTDFLDSIRGKDGQNGEPGADGIGIKSVAVNSEGKLIVTLSNDIVIDCGSVKGEQGPAGPQGPAGENGTDGVTPQLKIGEDNYWYVSYDNGTTWTSLGVKATGENGTNGSNGSAGENGADGVTPQLKIGEDNYWYVSYDNGATWTSLEVKATGSNGSQGAAGNGIASILKTSIDGLVDTYTITFTDGTTTTFTVTNGKDGEQGIQGIQGVPGKDGHTPVITIQDGYWYIDGVNTNVLAEGIKGETGNGISSIEKTSSEGLVDTYTITFTDGTTTTFTVTNGKDGQDGAQGIQGIQGIPGKDGHTPVITIQDGYWYIDGVNTNVLAEGIKGETGNGISSIEKTSTEGLVDTYTITFTDGTTTTFTVTNGSQGEVGPQGPSGVTPQLKVGEDNYWYVSYDNGATWTSLGVKATGNDGVDGSQGEQGVSIVDTAFDENGNMVITYSDGSTQIIEHTWQKYYTLEEADCQTDGKDLYSCTDCGLVRLVVVDKTGHSYEKTIVESTCTAQGYTLHTCSVCGDNYKDNYVETNGVHDFQEADTCVYCAENIENVAVETYNMSATAEDNVRGYVVPRADGMFDAYIKGTGAMKDYTSSSNPFYVDGYSIKNAYIGNGVTSIGGYAFYDCHECTNIIIPDSVTSIGSSAFYGCSSLTNITIPDGITSIGYSAFEYCSSLTSVTISNSVTSIGNYAFHGCRSLTSITIPDSVTYIGVDAFYNTEYYNNTDNWQNRVLYIDNCLIEAKTTIEECVVKEGTTIIASFAFCDCNSLTSITIPDSVTSIDSYAFYNCSSLTSVTIGNSVTSIGGCAFGGCSSLTSITIPDSVTSIGNSAFCDCSSLTSVTIPDSVTSIGAGAFCDCSSLTNITIPDSVTSIGNSAFCDCSSLTSITIPDSVTSIGNNAFYNCSALTSITIGNSVTSIGEYAFFGCSSLANVYYAGTEEQWSAISIVEEWSNTDLTNANIVFNHPDHNYIATVTPPTCFEQGYTTHTCHCGDSYVDSYVDALGHDTNGNYGSCSVCGWHNDKTKILYYYTTSWTTVYAYTWQPEVLGTWSGTAMTAVDGDAGWFSIDVPAETVNIIFNNGESTLTVDLLVADGPYFYNNKGYATKEDAEAAISASVVTIYTLKGSFDTWGAGVAFEAHNDNEVKIENFEMAAGTEFKVVISVTGQNDEWINTLKDGVTVATVAENTNITVAEAGNYDLYFDITTKQLWIEKVVEEHEHVTEGTYVYDDNGHWVVCTCGEKVLESEHVPGAEATETEPQICTVCEKVLAPALGHEHVTEGTYEHDENGHWVVCSCEEKVLVGEHDTEGEEGACSVCGYTKPVESEKVTVYFQNNWLWTDVKAYYWTTEGENSITNAEWPGAEMEFVVNDGTYDIYSVEVPVNVTALIINGIRDDGSETLDKTPDITIENKTCVMYYMVWEEENAVAVASYHTETTETVTEPDCTNAGEKKHTCSVCGNVRTEETKALGHTFVEGVCSICGEAEPTEEEKVTVYFQNNWLWTDVKAYYWTTEGENSITNAEWPGVAMTLVANDGPYDIYSVEVPANVTGLIISGIKDDGSGYRELTPDITTGLEDGVLFRMAWNDGNQVEVVCTKHTESESYSSDSINHWLICVNCAAVLEDTKVAHDTDGVNGVCSVCGFDPGQVVETTVLYLVPNENWKLDNARFAAYFFGNGEVWVDATDIDGDGIYEVVVPEGFADLIFCRMNPNATDNNWNNKWNKTTDLKVPTDGTNMYTVAEDTWDNGGGTWSELITSHQHDYQVVETAPTCTTKGYTTHTCHCGDSYVDSYVDALGHEYEDEVCTVCGDVLYSLGLEYTSINYGTSYAVSGIGDCTDIDIVIPSTYNDLPVTALSNRAFFGCDKITSITLPSSIISIGDNAFCYCYNLTSITIPSNVSSIGIAVFFKCTSLANINVEVDNQNFKIIDGNLYSKDGTTLVQYAIGKTDASFVVSNDVTTIGAWAFATCNSLVNVTIPNSVTNIGSNAFNNCHGLASLTIPNSVTNIGDGAFVACYDLTTVTLPEGLTNIPNDAFKSCRSLESITIPEAVTSIGDWAFESCQSLTSINIPKAVTSIGAYAFCNCVITSATFEGSNCWYVTDTKDATSGTYLNLSNMEQNSNYLLNLYCTQYWYVVLTGHTDGQWIIDIAPTCTTEGLRHQLCDKCGDTMKIEAIEPAGHSYDSVVTAPTCEGQGYTTHTCHCGDSYVDSYVDALGHDEVDHDAQAPTCTEIGWDEYVTCSRCDYTTYNEIPATDHIFGKWITVTEVTSTEAGLQQRTCKCGEVETRDMSFVYDAYGYSDLANNSNGQAMQQLYLSIYNACEKFVSNKEDVEAVDGSYLIEAIDISGMEITDAVAVWKVFYVENPIYYWLSNTLKVNAEDLLLCIDQDYATVDCREQCDLAIKDMVQDCNSNITVGMSDLGKALAIHDFICTRMNYAYESDGVTPQDDIWAHNMIGCAKYNLGVCESYAKTYQYLCSLNGIECITVTGFGGDEKHAWNLININDTWYGVDATWNDTGTEELSYSCFGMAKEYLDTDHTAESFESTGEDYLYRLPEVSSRSLELVDLHKGDTLVGTFGNIDEAFAAMDDEKGDYTIDLYEYELIGPLLISFPSIVHSINSSETPNVKSITIKGTYIGFGGGGTCTQLNINGAFKLQADTLILQDIIPIGEEPLYIQDNCLEITGEFSYVHIPIIGNIEDGTTSKIVCNSDKTEFYCDVKVYQIVGNRPVLIRAKAHVIHYVGRLSVYGGDMYVENLHYNSVDSYSVGIEPGPSSSKFVVDNIYGNDYLDIIISFGNLEEYPLITIGNTNCKINLFLHGEITTVIKDVWGNTIGHSVENANPFNVECAIATLKDSSVSDKIAIEYLIENSYIDKSHMYEVNTQGEIVLKQYTNIDDCIIMDTTLVHYAGSQTEVIIPAVVTSIGERAFYGCSSLTSITIPDSVTSIGSDAFCGCSNLTIITIPSSVTSIGEWAFQACTNITSITVLDGITSIGHAVFWGCTSLTNIIIPASVTSIGSYAFYVCESLTDVYYTGTQEQWEVISIGSSNTYLTDANRYYYSETQPTTSGNYWHYVDGVPTKW